MDPRAAAEAALADGNTAAALDFAREHLRRMGSDALPECRPLLAPEHAAGAPGIRETGCWEHEEVGSTARLVPGAMQFTPWAEPFRPRPLRRLLLERCVALAPGVLLTAGGALLDDNVGFTNGELCRHPLPAFPGIAASDREIILEAPRGEAIRLEPPAIYLPASANYAAWLFGELPRLAAFDDLDGLPIALHGAPSSFHFASLDALGIPRRRLIECSAQRRLECRELHYCTSTYFHHAPSPRALAYLRSRVLAELPAAPASPPRVYLSRRNVAGSRPLLNEDAFAQLLEGYGFVAVDPEALPFPQQVRLAAGAERIAGPYGANLANCIFARNARAAMIVATKGQPEFSRLLSALSIPHWHVVPDAVKLREGGTFSESYGFRVDLGPAEAVLRAFLGEPA